MFFLKVKSFITFYLVQYHKNTFRNEIFLSVYSILKMESYFAGFCPRLDLDLFMS